MKYKSSNTKIQQQKIEQNNLKPGLPASHDIWPGNRVVILSKEKIKEK